MHGPDSFTDTKSAFAIVSPCSKCKNQLAEMTDGKPLCPRRKAQSDLVAFQSDNNGNSDPQMALLATYGTEGTPQAGNNSLVNPVYLDNNNTSMVWIATLRDNNGVIDDKGNQLAPTILDPSFIPDHTDYIHCWDRPFLPAEQESHYRQVGALKEGDMVVATLMQSQQAYSTTDPTGNYGYLQVPVDGVVSKTNLTFTAPRAKVDLDYTVSGS